MSDRPEATLNWFRDIVQLGQIAIMVGWVYFIGIAPRNVLRGEWDNYREFLVGAAGLLFWGALAAWFVRGVSP